MTKQEKESNKLNKKCIEAKQNQQNLKSISICLIYYIHTFTQPHTY